MKTKAWYEGNKGLRMGRVKREASIAGEYNPKGKIVTCTACGCDTTNPDMLCDECK